MKNVEGNFNNNGLLIGGKGFLSRVVVTSKVDQALILLKINDYY